MAEKMAEIRITKCMLLIPERILLQYLPTSEIEQGIKRGKGYKRCLDVERRQERSRTDWEMLDIYGGST